MASTLVWRLVAAGRGQLAAVGRAGTDAPTEPIPCIYDFGLAVTTQGATQVMVGDKIFNYARIKRAQELLFTWQGIDFGYRDPNRFR